MNKSIEITLATAIAAFPLLAEAATILSAQDGAFNDTATWTDGIVPSAGDITYIADTHSVTYDQAGVSLGSLALLSDTPSFFTMNSGDLTLTSAFPLIEGTFTVNSGATLNANMSDGGAPYLLLARDAGSTATLDIDGGAYETTSASFMGVGQNSGQTSTLLVRNGGTLTSTKQFIFGGNNNTSGEISVTGGGQMSVQFIDFNQNNHALTGTQSRVVTMDGGTLTLTATNVGGSLDFGGVPNTQAYVDFNAGSIIWQGVDTLAEFNDFTTIFNGWVESGNITSSRLSAQELKDALVYNGIDAYLVYSTLPKTTLHVAIGGNDNSSGQSIDAPLASLVGARNRIRALREGGPLGPVEVLIRGGVYYESPTLVLEEQDSGTWGSPVVFKAYPGEKPVISGGRLIPSPSLSGSQYRVTVPGASGGQWPFRQLFIDDVRYTLARSPNEGYFYVQGIPPEPTGSYYGEPWWFAHNFIFKPGDLKNWSTLPSGDINLRVYSLWEEQTILLASVDQSNNTAATESHVLWGLTPSDTISAGGISKRYVVENAPDSLDAPGEWYLNRTTGVLSIIPFASEDLSTKTLVAPVTQKAIIINGDADANRFVEHIQFEGIAFKHYAPPPLNRGINGGWKSNQAAKRIAACIDIAGAKVIKFRDCEVSHIGSHAIRFGRGCTLNLVEQCHLYDLGGGGIYMGELITLHEPNRLPYDPGIYGATSHNTIYNNYIHDGGIIHGGGVGIMIGQSFDNMVTHNEIAHFNWSGMQIGWNWDAQPTWTYNNRIEYNHIHDIGQNVLSDLGGIYAVGENRNTIIGNNVIHDIYCWVEANGRGFYADQETSGVTFRNNLIYNTGGDSFGINFCRDVIVRNNVFAMNYGKATFNFGSRVDATITNNIFYTHYGHIYTDKQNNFNEDWIREMNYNLYWRIDGEPFTYHIEESFSFWKLARGWDRDSLEADPMFTDPQNGDFSFANTRNANAIGFVPVDWTQSGLVGPADWVDLPKRFERERSYRVHYEEFPNYKEFLPNRASDTFMEVKGASVVESGGQEYGAVTYSRVKIPLDVNDLEVRASSNLLTPLNNWSSLTDVQSVVDDGVITESVTIRDTQPISASESRYYRLQSQ